MYQLKPDRETRLARLCKTVINQHDAETIIQPKESNLGFWFGGGNMIEDADGIMYLVGRYRNTGDSRNGLQEGERGLELAVFASDDKGKTFSKLLSWSKQELQSTHEEIISIEGASLHQGAEGIELFVSSEKRRPYPDVVSSYLKPGAGVWSIDRIAAETISQLKSSRVTEVISSDDPAHLHVKDPFCYENPSGDLHVCFCTHPYSWSSSNSGFVIRTAGSKTFTKPFFNWFPRGSTWDVAISRPTCIVPVPAIGSFRNEAVSLIFYDGGECLRNLDQHKNGIQRPRGFSCEEIGGAAYCEQQDITSSSRLSSLFPLFVSPSYQTGTSRYVDVLPAAEGWYATWQQANAQGAQPLVMNFTSNEQIREILQ